MFESVKYFFIRFSFHFTLVELFFRICVFVSTVLPFFYRVASVKVFDVLVLQLPLVSHHFCTPS